jgi:predicted nuclease of restriction endonuclease-like (RecB) superfamily
MNYYTEIKDKLIKNEVSKKVRDYYNNRNDLNTYYEVGKLLSEAGKHYGEGIIKQYSIKLEVEINRKYSTTTLKRMRRFYILIEKGAPLAHQLSWSHYQELLSIKNYEEIYYYITISINQNLSRNQLREKIKNHEYQRLPNRTIRKLINNDNIEVTDFVKDPIVLNKKHEYNKISEYVLKEIIMNDLDNFLKELGNGFSYIGNEYKIKIGNNYNYIDMLLFNILFNCYVVVELKITELKKEHIGQIETYMNYIDKNVKNINHDKTIGIIICKKDNKYIIEYCSDKRIISREYLLMQ